MEFIWYYKYIKRKQQTKRKKKRERGYKLCYYISTKHQRQCQDTLSGLKS